MCAQLDLKLRFIKQNKCIYIFSVFVSSKDGKEAEKKLAKSDGAMLAGQKAYHFLTGIRPN